MAWEENLRKFTLESAGDNSGNQYRLMTVNADGQVARAGAGEEVQFVLYNKPSAQGHAAELVGPGSMVKVMFGASAAVGSTVGSDAEGRVVAAGTGDGVVGIVLANGGAADTVGTIWFNPSLAAPV